MAILKSNNPRENILLVGAIFQGASIIVAALGLCLFLVTILHAYSSKDWPKVNGKVTMGASDPQVGSESNTGTIWYEYQVGTKLYRSNRASFFEQNALYSHKEGDVVSIFYNPADCSDSCLVPGVSLAALLRLGFFASGFVVGVAIFLNIVHARFRKASNNAKETDGSVRWAMFVIIRDVFLHWW